MWARKYESPIHRNACIFIVEVKDKTKDESDYTCVLIDEKRFAAESREVLYIKAWRGKIQVTDGLGQSVEGVDTAMTETEAGYNIEVKMPWRYKTKIEPYDSIGFDCAVYDNRASLEYKSIIAWNDYKIRWKVKSAGELYFRKEN